MRVLFIPLAASSHYYPMVPLAWAFRAVGHEVRIAGQPPITEPILRSGHIAVPIGSSYDLLTNLAKAEDDFRETTGHRLAAFKDFSSMPAEALRRYVETRRAAHINTAKAMADELVEFTRAWRPDLVVTDLVTLVGPLVAAVAGVPLALHSWGPQFPTTNLPGYESELPPEIRALYERFGAEPRSEPAICVVDPCPPSLQAMKAPNQIVTRYVPYNGSGVTPDWLRRPAGSPRICVSWGVTNVGMQGMGKHPVLAIAEALASFDVDVVITVNSSDRANIGELPSGVRVVEPLPLQIVLPSCAVAVNHGGAGTIMTAASFGVPQVLLPQEQSDIFNSGRIAAVGAGVSLQVHETDAEGIATAVTSMLSDDTWSKAAQALREENAAQLSAAEVVRKIQELAFASTAS
jgi:UDP:flavonoid glycosyltransferase YjiC (YdhE family)